MRFTFRIESDNAAFEPDNRAAEVARLLVQAASKVEDGQMSGPLMDINGNVVGSWQFAVKARRRS